MSKLPPLNSLQKYRSRWHTFFAVIMWAGIILAVLSALTPTNTGLMVVALFIAFAAWSLQSVIFVDANTRGQ